VLSVTLGPARAWCSDRRGGVSAAPFATLNVADHVGDDEERVAENRRRMAAAAGAPPPETWTWLHQVHGSAVLVVQGAPGPGSPPTADAAVTAVPGRPLVVVTADCAPLVLANDHALGVVHAGHRGLLAGVVEAAVEALARIGRGPVRAFLGPCIRPDAYEFGADDLAPLVQRFGPAVASRTAWGTPALDVPAAVGAALARVGVGDLADCGICTSASADHFSHRRDGRTGRQATLAVLGP